MSKESSLKDRAEHDAADVAVTAAASDEALPPVSDVSEAPLPPDPLTAEDEADREDAKRRYLMQRFYHSATRFWSRDGDRLAWPLSLGVLALVVLDVVVKYGINVWNRGIFDALEARNSATVLWLSMIFLPLAIASVSCGVGNIFVRMTIQRRWRAWLAKAVVDRWLRGGRY